MESSISSTEVVRHIGEVLARVKHAGESFVLTKNNKPLARWVPVGRRVGASGREIMEALGGLAPDPSFADDLERVSRADVPPGNPWA